MAKKYIKRHAYKFGTPGNLRGLFERRMRLEAEQDQFNERAAYAESGSIAQQDVQGKRRDLDMRQADLDQQWSQYDGSGGEPHPRANAVNLLSQARQLNLDEDGKKELARITSGYRELQKNQNKIRPHQYDEMLQRWGEDFDRSQLTQYHTDQPTTQEVMAQRTQTLPNGFMAVQQPDGKIDIKDTNPKPQAQGQQGQATPPPYTRAQVQAIMENEGPGAQDQVVRDLANWVRSQQGGQQQGGVYSTGPEPGAPLAADGTTWFPSSMDQPPPGSLGQGVEGYSNAELATPVQRAARLAHGSTKQDIAEREQLREQAFAQLERKHLAANKPDENGNVKAFEPTIAEQAAEMKEIMERDYQLQMMLLGHDPSNPPPQEPTTPVMPEEPASPSDFPMTEGDPGQLFTRPIGQTDASGVMPPPAAGPDPYQGEVTPEMVAESQQLEQQRKIDGAAKQQHWNVKQMAKGEAQATPGIEKLITALKKSGVNRSAESMLPPAGIAKAIEAGNPNAADDIADAAATAIKNKTEHFSKLSAPDQAIELRNMIIVPRDQWDTFDFVPGLVYYDDKLNRYKMPEATPEPRKVPRPDKNNEFRPPLGTTKY